MPKGPRCFYTFFVFSRSSSICFHRITTNSFTILFLSWIKKKQGLITNNNQYLIRKDKDCRAASNGKKKGPGLFNPSSWMFSDRDHASGKSKARLTTKIVQKVALWIIKYKFIQLLIWCILNLAQNPWWLYKNKAMFDRASNEVIGNSDIQI